MATSDRPVTVRLRPEALASLMGLCVVDNRTLADELRQAVDEYIEARRTSPAFAEELAAARERQNQALDALVLDEAAADADAH